MIMMPIALKTLKESQTQEKEVLGDSFSAPSTFDPIVPTFFSPKPKKLFPAHTVSGSSFSKERNGVLAGPIIVFATLSQGHLPFHVFTYLHL